MPAFGEPSSYAGDSSESGTGVASMTANPLRWWTVRAFGRSPLARAADRVHAWAVVAGMVMLLAAVYPAVVLGQMGYAAHAHTVSAEAATRHPVEATALGNSKSDPTISESVATTFSVPVRWFAQNATQDTVTKVDQPVKAGDHVRIWLDDQGKVTTPPLTDVDGHVLAIGTAALVWLALAALVGVAFATLWMALERSRNRGWDRGLQELVGNGGGSATRKS